jgi:PHD/YefM family antitoxin component YafN of YafNO toxin-antitoxin module
MMEADMPIQYITNTRGKKVAVIIPLEEWKALQEKLDKLTPAEASASDSAWADYLAGKTKPLAQVIKEQLHDRRD